MGREEDLAPSLKALEAALGALAPRADRLDRDKLMFAAGVESARRTGAKAAAPVGRLAWPAGFAAMTAAAAVLAVTVLFRPGPEVVERVVYVPVEEPDRKEAAAPRQTPRQRAPEDPSVRPGLAETFDSALALGGVGRSWLALRREGLDPEGLERALASRQPAAGPDGVEPNEVRPGKAPPSYREFLNDLLQDAASGG